MKKRVRKRKNKSYRLIVLILSLLILILLLILLLAFIKTQISDGGLPSLGIGKIKISDIYNSDPLGLADGQHVLFIDQNNPNCKNSYDRNQALNPETPWCNSSVFGVWGVTSPLKPGDKVLFRNGTYYGKIFIVNTSIFGQEGNYIQMQPYGNEIVNLVFGEKYSGWTSLGNGIYSITINDLDSGHGLFPLYSDNLFAIKENGFGITRSNSLNEIYNPYFSNGLDLSKYNFVFVNTTTKQVFLRLVDGIPDNIYLTSSYGIETYDNTDYIEIRGFNLMYADHAIYIHNPHARLINNNIRSIAESGIVSGADYLYIDGNNISYIGSPLKWNGANWETNNLDHALYVFGQGYIIKNNQMSKCYGFCMHPWGSAKLPENYSIFNNLIQGGFVTNGKDIRIYNNIIYDSYSPSGIVFSVYASSSNIKIYNNLLIGSNSSDIIDIGRYGNSNLVDIDMRNNILISDNPIYCLQFTNNTNYPVSKMDNNIYYGCRYFQVDYNNSDTGFFDNNFIGYKALMNFMDLENNSFYIDPKLDGFFSLLSGSPAIDNGTCISWINQDYYSNPRPNGNTCDIGPFEYNLCGNNVCDFYENCSTCPIDCTICLNSTQNITNSTNNESNTASNSDSNNLQDNDNPAVVIASVNVTANNLSGNGTETDVETPNNFQDYIFYILVGFSFILLIVIVILFIVKYFKKKNKNNYVSSDNLEYLKR